LTDASAAQRRSLEILPTYPALNALDRLTRPTEENPTRSD